VTGKQHGICHFRAANTHGCIPCGMGLPLRAINGIGFATSSRYKGVIYPIDGVSYIPGHSS